MDIKEFVKNYNNANNKKMFLEKHIKRKYAPILEKRIVLSAMLDKSIIQTKNGTRYIDLILSKMNVTLAIVLLYTDFEIEKDDNNSIVDNYDLLIENDIMDMICEIIGEKEIGRIASMNQDLISEFYDIENSSLEIMKCVINNITQSFGTLINDGLQKIIDILSNDNKIEKIISMINNYTS